MDPPPKIRFQIEHSEMDMEKWFIMSGSAYPSFLLREAQEIKRENKFLSDFDTAAPDWVTVTLHVLNVAFLPYLEIKS